MKKKMMKITAIVVAALLFCGVFALTGCSCNPTEPLTDEPLDAALLADFTKTEAERDEFKVSGGWENGEPFNSFWKKENVSFENNKASLSISEMAVKEKVWDAETNAMVDCVSEYYGGEMSSKHYYGFGDYQVSMKPSAVTGTASTFFVCTGNYDKWYDEDGNVTKTNEHDEVDIEFLGKDTTKVQFNYFANDVGGHEYMYDLGFDASEEFHDYGFRWTEDAITWFVDDKPVYKVKKSEVKAGEGWPKEPGRVMTNYWSGTEKASAWMGEFADDYTGSSEYQWASTSATPCVDPASTKPGSQPEEPEPIPEGIVWDENTFFPFQNTPEYGVEHDTEFTKNTVTYTNVLSKSYKNIVAPGLDAAGRNYLGLTVKSTTDKPVVVRAFMQDAANNLLVKKGYVSEGAVKLVDGPEFTVPANGSIDLVCYFEGVADKIGLMLDSTENALAATNANVVEITDMKFGVKGEVVIPPESKNHGVAIGAEVVKFAGSSIYEIETPEDHSSMTVKYTDLTGGYYEAITAPLTSFGAHDTFTFKVKNTGENSATVRLDVLCAEGAGTPLDPSKPENGKNNFCNLGGEISGPGGIDHTSGYQYSAGDSFRIAAGLEATCTVTITPSLATGLMFYLDSGTYEDTKKYTNALEFSAMSLSTVGEPDEPDPGDEGNVLASATFASSGDSSPVYTVAQTDSLLTATYAGVSGSCYADVSADVSSILGDNNTLSFKVKNNGSATSKICVTVVCPDGSGTGGKAFCNTSADITGAETFGNDYAYGGADWLKIAAGATATVSVKFTTGVGANKISFNIDSSTFEDTATYSGSVEFTEMSLSAVEDPAPVEGVNVLESATFASSWGVNSPYTLTQSSASLTATYNNLGGGVYAHVSANNVESILGSNNTLTFKVKNNGSATSKICVTIAHPDTAAPGGFVFHNTSATVTGALSSGNDYANGGADWLQIAAGATATVTVRYTAAGANMIMFNIDTTWGGSGTYTGSVEFTEMSLSAVEDPAPAEKVNVLESATFASSWGVNSPYTLTQSSASLTATYNSLAGGVYANVIADISGIVADNNALTFKVKNNGTATSKICVTVGKPKDADPTQLIFCNTSAEITGALEFGNDYQYGGADWLKIAAGATATVTVHFTSGVENANKITFNIDTTWGSGTYTGSVEFTEMNLSAISA